MKRSLVGAVCTCGLLLAMACGAYALSTGDSLISLSYLTDKFIPETVEQGSEQAEEMLRDTYDEAVEELEKVQKDVLTGLTGSEGLYSPDLREREWGCGDVVTLETGAGALVVKGAVQVNHDGAVIDITAGEEVPSGTELTEGHRYLVGEDTLADFIVLTGTAKMGVQGGYEAEKMKYGLPFYDLRGDDWYYDAVRYVYTEGLFSGVGDGRFAPEMTMDRAMVMTVFYRLAGSPEKEMAEAEASFSDVPADAWYADFVRWGAAQSITSGTGADTFSPTLTVTREQMVTLLYSFATRYLGLTLESRADITGYSDYDKSSTWARDALSWAVEDGILDSSWTGVNSLGAHKNAGRAEVAAMLQAFQENIL